MPTQPRSADLHRGSGSGLLATASVLLQYRRLILLSILLVTVTMVGLGLARERTYTSTITFMPHSARSALAGLSSIASQFGVNVGKEDPAQSPDFYSEVLKSRVLLTGVSRHSYATRAGEPPRPLADVLAVPGANEAQRQENVLRRLQGMIFVGITRQTGVLNVNVTSPSPVLSQLLGRQLITALDSFNLDLRRKQAEAEARFLEERERDARRDQEVAEQRVVDFLRRNLDYSRSPSLAWEYTRLTRDAASRSEVASNLAQGRAQAGIEAARNTPVITVLADPTLPTRADPRGLLGTGLLAVFVGLLLGIILAFLANAFSSAPDDEEAARFARLRAEAAHDLRHPVKGLLRRRQPDGSVRGIG